jgi:hypothetical protein
MPVPFLNLTGKSIGLWTVLDRGPNTSQGKPQWWCQCACGTKRLVSTSHLTRKIKPSQSCGCLRTRVGRPVEFHGHTHSPEYIIWQSMNARCLDPNNPRYMSYGGRGISICLPWRTSFLAFYADMGARPSPQHTIERLRNNEGYSPDNCVWATQAVQCRNRRSNRWLTLHDRTECLIDWSLITGIPRHTIESRIDRYGWSIERALTTPNRSVSPRKV